MTRGRNTGRPALLAPLVLMLVLAACATAPASAPASSPQAPGASLPVGFPIGTWTTTITEADLQAGGLTEPAALRENAGLFTMTLAADGTWTIAQQTEVPIRWPVFRGTWTPTGPNSFDQRTEFPPDYAGDVVGFTWQVDGDELLLRVPDPPDPVLGVLTEAHPWVRAN
jgi:hypothetical protein